MVLHCVLWDKLVHTRKGVRFFLAISEVLNKQQIRGICTDRVTPIGRVSVVCETAQPYAQ